MWCVLLLLPSIIIIIIEIYNTISSVIDTVKCSMSYYENAIPVGFNRASMKNKKLNWKKNNKNRKPSLILTRRPYVLSVHAVRIFPVE